MVLRANVLRVGQEKINFFLANMTGSANHSIKQVTLAEEEVSLFLIVNNTYKIIEAVNLFVCIYEQDLNKRISEFN